MDKPFDPTILSRRELIGLLAASALPGTAAEAAAAAGVPTIGLFAQAHGAAVPHTVDMVATTGRDRVGSGAGVYVNDRLCTPALAEAHPLLAFTAADGRVFRFAVPADGFMPAQATGAFGTAAPDHRTNHQPALMAAIAYATAVQGVGRLRLEPGVHYSCWVPPRTGDRIFFRGNTSGVCFAPTAACEIDLNGATLHRRAPGGADPAVPSNWQEVGGAIWRGGAFFLQPRHVGTPPNLADRWHMAIRNGRVLGGIPRGATYAPNKYPTVAKPDGWDECDKFIAQAPDAHNGDLTVENLEVDGFRGELFYGTNDFRSRWRFRNIHASNTNAQFLNPNGCDVDVVGFRGEKGGFAIEGFFGRQGRLRDVVLTDSIAAGAIQGGLPRGTGHDYSLPTRVFPDEVPYLHMQDVTLRRCGSVYTGPTSLVLGSFLTGELTLIDTPSTIGDGGAVRELHDVDLRLRIVCDQADKLHGPSIYNSKGGAGEMRTDRVHLDISFERTAAARANNRKFSLPINMAGSLGPDITIATRLDPADFINVVTVSGPLTDFAPRFSGDVFAMLHGMTFNFAAVDVTADPNVRNLTPVIPLRARTSGLHAVAMPTNGAKIVPGHHVRVLNDTMTSSFGLTGVARRVVLGPGEWVDLVWQGPAWNVLASPPPLAPRRRR